MSGPSPFAPLHMVPLSAGPRPEIVPHGQTIAAAPCPVEPDPPSASALAAQIKGILDTQARDAQRLAELEAKVAGGADPLTAARIRLTNAQAMELEANARRIHAEIKDRRPAGYAENDIDQRAIEQRAQALYKAYCAHTDWKSAVTGADLPAWKEVKQAVREAWFATAKATANW